MLTLAFSKQGVAPVLKRGPYPGIRADARALRAEGDVIARHQNHCWCVGTEEFFRIDCEGPVKAYFQGPGEERSPLLGPFMHFSSADGVAYADGEMLGHVDVDADLWYGHTTQRHWEEIVVVPAG